jgi:hypothetical protein
MPEKIVDILNAITEAKGEAFTEGFVEGINLATAKKKPEQEQEEG